MRKLLIVAVAVVLRMSSDVNGAHYSCMDIYLEDQSQPSGEYTILNDGRQITVFCDFREGYGFTFINSSTTGNIDISSLYNVNDHAMIRTLKSGQQFESKMEQLSSYPGIGLSFQYNSAISYQGPPNADSGLEPYLFLGFLPEYLADTTTKQGYVANDVDFTFNNCDNNGNSFFAFYLNPDGNTVTTAGASNTFMDGFHSASLAVEVNMPPEYYMLDFVLHFGGCGGLAKKGAYASSGVEGIALGLPFRVTCDEEKTDHVKIVKADYNAGGVVTYECETGTDLITGNLVRTCLNSGKLNGSKPVCGVCPSDGLIQDIGCLYISTRQMSFYDAMALCRLHHLRPLEITDISFQTKLENHLVSWEENNGISGGEYWLAATDEFHEGVWYWAGEMAGSRVDDGFTRKPLASMSLHPFFAIDGSLLPAIDKSSRMTILEKLPNLEVIGQGQQSESSAEDVEQPEDITDVLVPPKKATIIDGMTMVHAIG
ncbi:hypothetical protein ScPMuIL_006680 [Solemya velum]